MASLFMRERYIQRIMTFHTAYIQMLLTGTDITHLRTQEPRRAKKPLNIEYSRDKKCTVMARNKWKIQVLRLNLDSRSLKS